MAEGKKTFIFYSDWINMIREMPDNDAGALLKHVLSYVNDEDPKTDNLLVKMAFGHMKPILKRDLEKWETQLQNFSQMGKKSAEKRALNQEQHKSTYVEPTSTVNVNVNDNVNVNVNKNDNKSLKKEKTEKVFSEEIKSIYEKSLSFFSENLHPKNPNDWMKCIDELIRIDKIPPEIILEATQRARADSFWSGQFMTLTKLRRKSPDGIPYIVVFYEKFLKPKSNGTNKANNGKGVTEDELARTLHEHFLKQREQNGTN